MKKNVSLKDIAGQVGVSVSLVSYVLNGHAKKMRVGEEMTQQIIETARKLHYQPNQIAKSLKSKKSQTIGLIVAEIKYGYTAGIVRSIEEEAAKNGYTVIIGNCHEDLRLLHELIQVFITRQVDGLIIVASEKAEAEVQYLKKKEMPFVLIDRIFPSVESNFIGIDNFQVAFNATQYLHKHGLRRIAMINYASTFFHLRERSRGYLEALEAHKLRYKKSLLREIQKSSYDTDVQTAIRELTSPPLSCDAIFFATDTLAITGLKNLIELKKRIPEDIAAISFDESESFALFQCPVTHYRQPLNDIGTTAIKTLVEEMKNEKPGKKQKWKQLYLESTLVIGKSCRE
ncbi:MAG TPA: LacI family DNA-binding transcriptional regulator [Puia sp.]|nr:LacI family DNA-binding transcriptional regulator [Puia sp.]